MASAARVHAVENGKETSGRTLIAFGGAAPLHAARLAQKLGIRRVVVPPDAGVGSALGFLGAPIAYEVVRTLLVRLDALEQATIDALFAEMRAEAEAVVRLGVPQGELVGDAHRVHALSRPGPRGRGAAARRHARPRGAARGVRCDLYARLWPRHSAAGGRGGDLDARRWPSRMTCRRALPTPPDAGRRDADPGTCRIVETASGETVDASLFVRSALPQGARVTGPAVIVEDGTSTIVPTGYAARIGAGDDIVIEEIEA